MDFGMVVSIKPCLIYVMSNIRLLVLSCLKIIKN